MYNDLERTSIEVRVEEIKSVSFSLRGPSHMVINTCMNETQLEEILNQWWEYVGDDLFIKFFAREGYTLTKDK